MFIDPKRDDLKIWKSFYPGDSCGKRKVSIKPASKFNKHYFFNYSQCSH